MDYKSLFVKPGHIYQEEQGTENASLWYRTDSISDKISHVETGQEGNTEISSRRCLLHQFYRDLEVDWCV